LDGVDTLLRDAERWLDAMSETDAPSAEMIVMVDEDFRLLPGSIAMYRAGLALVRGDVANTMRHAWQVLELVREDDHLIRGSAAGLLGLAYWTSGDLEAGHQWY